MSKYTHTSRYFYGVEIPQEEIDRGYISYRTLAETFEGVLCNDITKLFYANINGEYNEPELYNGSDYDEENNYYYDIYQYFIIDKNGVDILSDCTNEIIYYLPTVDIYIWGITHFGTLWDCVDTDIKIELEG